jgi:hypothetical protein
MATVFTLDGMRKKNRDRYSRTIGVKVSAGTAWPVEVRVRRVKKGKWMAFKLCQGVGGTGRYFRSMHEALAWASTCGG